MIYSFVCLFAGEDAYNANGTNSILLSGGGVDTNSSTANNTSTSIVPSSQSVQQLCLQQQSSQIGQQIGNCGSGSGSGGVGGLVTHSHSAYEIGQVPLTPLAQHQQAIHQQLQQRFANANINSGE